MGHLTNATFILSTLVFIVVFGFWAWAAFLYISAWQKILALPADLQKNARENLDPLLRIINNKAILAAVVTSPAGAIFGLLGKSK